MIRISILFVIAIYAFACSSKTDGRSGSRPGSEGEGVDGFLSETEDYDVINEDGAVIQSGDTTITLPVNLASDDYTVRLTKLSTPPPLDEDLESTLGDPLGDVVKIEIIDAKSQLILSDSDLNESYTITQTVSTDAASEDLGMLVLTDPGSESESLILIDSESITVETALTLLTEVKTYRVSANLKVTSGVIWVSLIPEETTELPGVQVAKSEEIKSTGGVASVALLESGDGTPGPWVYSTEIELTFGDTTNYSSIEVRRSTGANAPENCSSGTVVFSTSTFTDTSFIDDVGPGSQVASYLICIHTDDGRKVGAQTLKGVAVKVSQTIFVSSTQFGADFTTEINATLEHKDSIAAADAHCQTLAETTDLKGKFSAVLADFLHEPFFQSFRFVGPLVNIAGDTVLTENTLLMGSFSGLENPVRFDQNGVDVASAPVWTGMTASGDVGDHCNAFRSSSNVSHIGRADAVDQDWLGAETYSCSNGARMYCVQQGNSDFAVEYTAIEGTLEMDVSLSYPAITTGFGKVRLVRKRGAIPESDCGGSSTNVYETTSEFEDTTIRDALSSINSQGIWTYRVCGWDQQDRMIHSQILDATKFSSSPFIGLFATTPTYQIYGDISLFGHTTGIAAADGICREQARLLGYDGDDWRVFIYVNERNLQIEYPVDKRVVAATLGVSIGSNAAEFWDYVNGVVNAPFGMSQTWFGSDTENCANWTMGDGGGVANVIELGNGAGTSWNCNTPYSLLCIDLPEVTP